MSKKLTIAAMTPGMLKQAKEVDVNPCPCPCDCVENDSGTALCSVDWRTDFVHTMLDGQGELGAYSASYDGTREDADGTSSHPKQGFSPELSQGIVEFRTAPAIISWKP